VRRDHIAWLIFTLVVVSLGLTISNALIVGHFHGSDRLTAYEVFIAVSTFVLVAGQVVLAFRQTSIAADQKEISLREITLVEQQGKILERQELEMNRKARLMVWANHTAVPTHIDRTNSFHLYLIIGNDGSKAARDCTLVLWVPPYIDGLVDANGWHWTATGLRRNFDGVWYFRHEAEISRVFFSGKTTVMPVIVPNVPSGVVDEANPLYCRLIYEDGAFPDADGIALLSVAPPRPFLQQPSIE
jgi:hypothetical protein